MRIISFSRMWDKLQDDEFTTFRFPRKDKDWYKNEKVQVYYKNRSPHRQSLVKPIVKINPLAFIVASVNVIGWDVAIRNNEENDEVEGMVIGKTKYVEDMVDAYDSVSNK